MSRQAGIPTALAVDTAAAVLRFSQEHGYPPGIRDLAALFGIGRHAVWGRLACAAGAGLIQWRKGAARTLHVNACRCKAVAAVHLPLTRYGEDQGGVKVAKDGICAGCGGVVLIAKPLEAVA